MRSTKHTIIYLGAWCLRATIAKISYLLWFLKYLGSHLKILQQTFTNIGFYQ